MATSSLSGPKLPAVHNLRRQCLGNARSGLVCTEGITLGARGLRGVQDKGMAATTRRMDFGLLSLLTSFEIVLRFSDLILYYDQ